MSPNSQRMASIEALLDYLGEDLIPMLPATIAKHVAFLRINAAKAWVELCSQLPNEEPDAS